METHKPLVGLPSFDMADLGMSSHFEIVLRCARTLLECFWAQVAAYVDHVCFVAVVAK